MRNIFIYKLSERAKKNKNVILLTGDLGFKYFDDFKKNFPKQFINVGIAENNMINIAVGLALNGKEVYVYSILPFLVFKSLEQIRNNIANLDLNIKLIGGGGGFSYNTLGISHNTSEDINILRSIPNLHVLNPSFDLEAEKLIDYMFNLKKPSFIRLGKSFKIEGFERKNIKLLNGNIIQKGNEMCIITSGNILQNVLQATAQINDKKISIVSFPILKPIKQNSVHSLLNKFKKILIIEESSEIGGLKSIILENSKNNEFNNTKFFNISLKDKPHHEIGTVEYLRKINNLSSQKIKKMILKIIN